jgi:hypothetical protein
MGGREEGGRHGLSEARGAWVHAFCGKGQKGLSRGLGEGSGLQIGGDWRGLAGIGGAFQGPRVARRGA